MCLNIALYCSFRHFVWKTLQKIISGSRIYPEYQPVVYAKDGTLCGAEALARWLDPKRGKLMPKVFVEPLENARLAYKLDFAILECVCRNIRNALDNYEIVLPTSVNISRSDFDVDIDVPNKILEITEKYQIPHEFLHIEITESTVAEENEKLLDAVKRIKKNGFALWLDDFGSGESSFKTLKDYPFDVLKLDQVFLKGLDQKEKSKPIIESVIKMAESINMGTLCEGVEYDEDVKFLFINPKRDEL